jgi:hypothetical protein
MIQPVSVWPELASENKTRRRVVLDFLLPFSVIVGIASLMGTLFQEGIEDSFSIAFLLLTGSISFFIIFFEAYLSGWLITEIAMSFDAGIRSNAIFNLVIYSHIPFFLTLTFSRLVPQLLFLNLLGVYSFYLYWTGIEIFTTLKDDRKPVFMILSILVMILMYLLLTVIFNSIYDVVLSQLTTFRT